jgi:FtsP/CotA-like multicopper oxidase with cupredoxin domain
MNAHHKGSGLTIAVLVGALVLSGCVTAPDPSPVTREFTLEAKESLVELYPGKSVTMWTFNDIVPGPLIRVREGDRVLVHFYNNHTLPHNVHFHGAHPIGMDGVQEVAPGAHFTYDFIAGPAGAFVYHCHVDTRIHIQKGLYGQFVVDPKTGSGAAAPEREHFVVFSDWNPNLNATPEAYTINGRSFPSTIPFQVELGKTARFYVSSLSMISVAAHFHGVLAQQIWPNQQPIDVMSLSPGETRVMDYRSDHAGVWMFHDHFEDHLVNDDTYPGGTVGLIEVGKEFWSSQGGGHDHAHASGGEATSESAADGLTVVMKDYRFASQALRVRLGETVTWRNDDPVPHTVTSDDEGGPLDSGNIAKGGTFAFTFTQPGTYAYHCVPHSGKSAQGYVGMVGTIIVSE